jgi:hypothetical protein
MEDFIKDLEDLIANHNKLGQITATTKTFQQKLSVPGFEGERPICGPLSTHTIAITDHSYGQRLTDKVRELTGVTVEEPKPVKVEEVLEAKPDPVPEPIKKKKIRSKTSIEHKI